MLAVCDLRDPTSASLHRVNVSRRSHSNEDSFERALGNPFRVAAGDEPGAASAQFRSWLWERLQAQDAGVLAALERIEALAAAGGVELACWCRGARTCHAHVIVRCVKWRAELALRARLDQLPRTSVDAAPYVHDAARARGFTHHRDMLAAVISDPDPDDVREAADRDQLDALVDERIRREHAGDFAGWDRDLYERVRDRVRDHDSRSVR